MVRLVIVLLLGMLAAGSVAAAGSDDQGWAVRCPPSRPLAANRCGISPLSVQGDEAFAVLFAYMGPHLNFLISGGQRYTHGEVRIDGSHVFMTQLCGKGFCVFSGRVAEEMAELFRKGREAEVELFTRKRNFSMNQHIDLSGFEVAYKALRQSAH